ncbi:AAA family ATPase [Blastococcus xanthinilyticus]|uniref:ATPase family protein associated with various cellular activities (AAA) n=1 Tax=Blastococcus xanthinilyticus TaxID=1564164 RepID=A0A5S5CLI7_9ACTN|nr:ATP-binding protein [Blastococcus xanthinilyticus]TYP81265.1 ATPase family protein associated with various cellular activities (AAA) [Blastococcus xanthinilyticus]
MPRRTRITYSGSYQPLPSAPPAADGPLRPELADVGRLARRGVRAVVGAARAGERPALSALLVEHLGGSGTGLDVVEEAWPGYEHVNVQAGLEAWLAAPGRTARLVGVVGHQHRPFGLGELLGDDAGPRDPFGPRPGNAASVNLACGPDGAVRPCVRCGLYLVTEGEVRTAVLLRGADPEYGHPQVSVQVVSSVPDRAGAAAAGIRAAAVEHNVFRGQVLSFGQEVFGHGQTLLQFHRRPDLRADQLILAPATLAEIQRQVVDVARHKARLLAAGQHLKRGVLLYGPPGVGKTHTVRYLMSSLQGTTVIQLTGNALHLIAEACSVARALQPAMVIVEDVDLIAEDRGMHPGQHPLLFQLLNEMDGLAEDADVVFVLTTNRADLLEPALAARPGRVDQAVALELPDAAARRALFDLYRGSLRVDTSRLDDVLARSEGVTASFLKELLRRAALLAASRTAEGERLEVSAADLDAALDELLDTRNAMTRALLGSTPG